MAKVHVLNQYLWPDGAPTGIYAEMLADRLALEGCDVALVGGGGSYRKTTRPEPATPIVRLRAQRGRRGSHLSTLGEYWSVNSAFTDYVRREVREGDVVIISSAPPTTVHLHRVIHQQGATGIYWLQDYYPELLRGVWNYPAVIRAMLDRHWHRHLASWDRVVKSAANLGYHGANAAVIRNWPTLTFAEVPPPEPGTALYTGNFGYGHDVASFVAKCEELRARGCRIVVRGDGPGLRRLPSWIDTGPAFSSEAELRAALIRHELHLVAAHPDIRAAIFPSKIWNSLAAGREVIGTGFAGEMADELAASRDAAFTDPLRAWEKLVAECLARELACPAS
ncbi:MAG: hypothetical protein ABMA13_06915 [Chthoniobacteraceae bacterium]